MTSPEPTVADGRRLGGRQFVVVLYCLLVGVAALIGVLFTVAVDDPASPALFFLFDLPPTALGFGLYGGVTIAVVLGVPLLFVVAVSEFVDDVDAVGRADVEGEADDEGRADGDENVVADGDHERAASTDSPKD